MASSRGNPDIGDILRSVAVIGVIVLGLFGIGKFFTVTPEDPVSAVDYETTLQQVRTTTDIDVLAPATLPDGWRATSARFEPGSGDRDGSWHLGVITADDEYLGLEQSSLSVQRAAERWAEDSEEAGSAQVAGQVWSVRAGPRDRTTYVASEGDRTTLVTGTVPPEEIETYISSLSE
ncbi:DUF4245 domain-containing protein [Aeromicrobium sp. CF3.5]|uniref:DUF4245 domain-containing protein n=1 Tax=Aeromicrobium sp. CF3.5 TaxID=3373078 RepID=UPI003EE65609